jgi:hypothetical protein
VSGLETIYGKIAHFCRKMKFFRNERYRLPDTWTVLGHTGNCYFHYFFSNFVKNKFFSIFDFLSDLSYLGVGALGSALLELSNG